MTFSRTLAENSVASSNAQPTAVRSAASGMSRTSVPPISTRPLVVSASRGTSCSSVVLPDPVAPTSTSVSPRARLRSTSRSTGTVLPG